uniref:Uncharacterized protein n=1 Tax=Zea mays TaxID=4577 RepID=A0A804MI93_MAIZE
MVDLLSSSLFPAAARQRRDNDFHARRPKLQPLPASSLLPLLGEAPRVLRGEGKPLNARRMFGAMHKSESPSSLQTPIGFVYGPRDDDRASDVVPPTRCSRWTTQGRMDIPSGCSPSEYLPQQTLSKC